MINTESSYLMCLDANNLYGWGMSQELPVNGFKWVKKLSKLNEYFITDYDENSNTGYFLEVDVQYPKKNLIFIRIFHFYLKERKLKNFISLFVTSMTKKTMSHKSFKTSIKSRIDI